MNMEEITRQESGSPELQNFTSKFLTSKYGELLVDCNFVKKDGRSITKRLTLDKYVNMLANKTIIKEEEAPMINLGRLPQNLYDGAVASDGKLAAVLVYPAEKRYFKPTGGKGMYIAFPRLVFGLKTSADGRITRGLCFSLKEGELTPDTSLYLYPYGNVSHQGHICWGDGLVSSNLNALKSFEDLKQAVELFFSSSTAAHYYSGGINTKLKISHAELVAEMEKSEVFPEEILQPADTKLGEIINLIS